MSPEIFKVSGPLIAVSFTSPPWPEKEIGPLVVCASTTPAQSVTESGPFTALALTVPLRPRTEIGPFTVFSSTLPLRRRLHDQIDLPLRVIIRVGWTVRFHAPGAAGDGRSRHSLLRGCLIVRYREAASLHGIVRTVRGGYVDRPARSPVDLHRSALQGEFIHSLRQRSVGFDAQVRAGCHLAVEVHAEVVMFGLRLCGGDNQKGGAAAAPARRRADRFMDGLLVAG